MCASYLVHSETKKLAKKFGAAPTHDIPEGWSETRIVPRILAPIVLETGGERILKSMMFTFIPSWAPEPKVKFASFNARLDAAEKNTWKQAFEKQRCLVPLTTFLEPIYINQFAGHWVKFFHNEHDIIVAAGIYNIWVNRKTGEELSTFAIVTDEPYPFVKEIGHRRSPLFLDEKAYDKWLSEEPMQIKDVQELALSNKAELNLQAEQGDAMKAGWEKRIPKD